MTISEERRGKQLRFAKNEIKNLWTDIEEARRLVSIGEHGKAERLLETSVASSKRVCREAGMGMGGE
jgi:hypothetical protein